MQETPSGRSYPRIAFGTVDMGAYEYVGPAIEIRWPSVTDRSYTLQAGSNLVDGFILNLRTNILATPPVNVHTDAVEGVECRFYRVRVE